MKNLLSLYFILNLFIGCTFANSQSLSNNISYFIGDKFAVFYDQSNQKFYAAQYETKPNITLSSNISIIEAKNDALIIKDLSNGSVHTFAFNATTASAYSVYGIIQFGGTIYNDKLLIKNTAGQLILNIAFLSDPSNNDNIPEVKCGCKKQGSNEGCDHGGEGSNSCSVTDSGGIATATWNHTCAVSCDKGYYACCKKNN